MWRRTGDPAATAGTRTNAVLVLAPAPGPRGCQDRTERSRPSIKHTKQHKRHTNATLARARTHTRTHARNVILMPK